ncbi:hypothetical protein AX16_002899 [Volvariella volvacea WC 439]|nr:hypothetical protein AX16_002899 [Volvariella volvacea WC 439]
MGWLSSLFRNDVSSARKGQALSSTHEAFSLPTSSPVFPSSDAFHADTLQTPDPETASSPAYTYPPPQGANTYGYIPTSSRQNSLLPTHHDPYHTPLSPTSPYPPLQQTWDRIRAWLTREYPELGDTLNYGILPQDLSQVEMQFGFALPTVVRESYLCVDGQEAESSAGCSEGLFFGLNLLPLEDVLEEWKFWREVDDDPATGANPHLREAMQSIPPGWIRKEYSQRGWIPLVADKAGNYIGVDLNPGEGGTVGQVIVFGRDFDTKVVLWRGEGPAGWAKWLANFAEELESGEGFEIGANSEPESGSEDDVGYEGYFFDGTGRGQGDGGGDSGSGGGLRLTGEYRGWNVLEAWADKSLKKWYEAGIISNPNIPGQLDTRKVDKVGLGIPIAQESAAEVPIPVLANLESPVPPPSASAQRLSSSTPVPTISVTKPPAPLPVDVPTPSDISPPESPHPGFDEDLEAGRRTATTMREIHNQPRVINPRQPPSSINTSNVSIQSSQRSPISPSSAATERARSPIQDPLMAATPTAASFRPIPDLLSESTPSPTALTGTNPALRPSSPSQLSSTPLSVLASSSRTELPEVTHVLADEHDEHEDAEEAEARPLTEGISSRTSDDMVVVDLAADEIPKADTTIRLIGGGGTSGPAAAEADTTAPATVNSTAVAPTKEKDPEVSSIASVDSAASGTNEKTKKHNKRRSGLAGLKKLGQLGRKKDSGSSIKEIVGGTASPAS